MANNIFNLKRFLNLLKKTIFERPTQTFGLTFLVMALVLILYTSCRFVFGYESTQVITFFLGLIAGGYFLAGTVLGNYSTSPTGSSFLTLPASAFEKWLCGVIIILLLFLPLFLIFYRIMDASLVTLYHNSLNPNKADYQNLYDSAKILAYDREEMTYIFSFFTNITGAMLLGSLYFNKISIIKVALLCAAIFFGAFGINYLIAGSLFDNLDGAAPFQTVRLKMNEDYWRIELPDKASMWVGISFKYLLPVVFYVLAYIRLREKEF